MSSCSFHWLHRHQCSLLSALFPLKHVCEKRAPCHPQVHTLCQCLFLHGSRMKCCGELWLWTCRESGDAFPCGSGAVDHRLLNETCLSSLGLGLMCTSFTGVESGMQWRDSLEKVLAPTTALHLMENHQYCCGEVAVTSGNCGRTVDLRSAPVLKAW